LSDFSSRKEPSFLDQTIPDLDRIYMDESDDFFDESVSGDETLIIENRRGYSGSSRIQQKRKFTWPLLTIAIACLSVVLWLATRSAPDTPSATVVSESKPAEVVAASSGNAAQSVTTNSSAPEALPAASPQAVVPATTVVTTPAPMTPVSTQTQEVATDQREKASATAEQATKLASPPKHQKMTLATTKPVVQKPDAINKKTTPVEKIAAKPRTTKWTASPERFTVQLVAAYSEAGVKRVQANLPSSTPNAIHKTKKEGKPWFILIYGSYATKQEALNAQAHLPAVVTKELKPWVRRQGEVFSQ